MAQERGAQASLLRRSSDRTNDRSRVVRRTVSGETAVPALRSVSSSASAAAAAAAAAALALRDPPPPPHPASAPAGPRHLPPDAGAAEQHATHRPLPTSFAHAAGKGTLGQGAPAAPMIQGFQQQRPEAGSSGSYRDGGAPPQLLQRPSADSQQQQALALDRARSEGDNGSTLTAGRGSASASQSDAPVAGSSLSGSEQESWAGNGSSQRPSHAGSGGIVQASNGRSNGNGGGRLRSVSDQGPHRGPGGNGDAQQSQHQPQQQQAGRSGRNTRNGRGGGRSAYDAASQQQQQQQRYAGAQLAQQQQMYYPHMAVLPMYYPAAAYGMAMPAAVVPALSQARPCVHRHTVSPHMPSTSTCHIITFASQLACSLNPVEAISRWWQHCAALKCSLTFVIATTGGGAGSAADRVLLQRGQPGEGCLPALQDGRPGLDRYFGERQCMLGELSVQVLSAWQRTSACTSSTFGCSSLPYIGPGI